MTTIKALCDHHNITTGKVIVGVDCEGAINKVDADHPPKANEKHYDLIMECRRLRASLPVTVEFKWIEGHQDKKGKRLDWWARQNIRMDQRAKQFWRKHKHNPRHNQNMAIDQGQGVLAGIPTSDQMINIFWLILSSKP